MTSYRDELIFVTGGERHTRLNSKKTKRLDQVIVFDTMSNTFSKATNLHRARARHGSTVQGKKLYVFGGTQVEFMTSGLLEILDFSAGFKG